MKILVDELPTCPRECKFHMIMPPDFYSRQLNGCILSDEEYFECKMGSDKFECPHLREFSANVPNLRSGYFKDGYPVKLTGSI